MEDRTARRSYRMKDRAKAQAETRDRIVSATMLMHDEKGVAATSFVDIARRAGIGAATVYRHFPTLGSLVAACGAHVWKEMDPPVPERASETFKDIVRTEDRLQRLVDEVDRFYRRGALRLTAAYADRHLIPELDEFLRAVEAGVAALVREAVKDRNPAGRRAAASDRADGFSGVDLDAEDGGRRAGAATACRRAARLRHPLGAVIGRSTPTAALARMPFGSLYRARRSAAVSDLGKLGQTVIGIE